MEKEMTARFPGTCNRCNGPIAIGDRIVWSEASGARHGGSCPVFECNVAPVAPVNLEKVVALLHGARERGLLVPRVRVLAPDGKKEMTLALAKRDGRHPNSVNVKIQGIWLGRVNPDASVHGTLKVSPEVLEALRIVGEDPAAAAKRYSALMCRCSFCGMELTDAGSVEVGYGPICAQKYDLPHTPLGSVRLVPVGEPTFDELRTELERKLAEDEITEMYPSKEDQ